MERFSRTVLDEFFRTAFRTKFYETLHELQDDLDQWLFRYNTERPLATVIMEENRMKPSKNTWQMFAKELKNSTAYAPDEGSP